MHRLWCLVVIGAVSVVGAGPAFAAKGGNNDTAHACQQGGHENRFEAETGRPFKNAGDCASHGAQGGAASSLTLQADQYEDEGGNMDWGIVFASGLQPNSQVTILNNDNNATQFTTTADNTGNVSFGNGMVFIPCDASGELKTVSATATTSQNQPITSSRVSAPC